MEWLAQAGLSNAFVATLLALLAAVVGVLVRRPALTHGLWLLVLLKLVTPPLASVAVLPARVEATSVPADEPADWVIEPMSSDEVEAAEAVPLDASMEEDTLPALAPPPRNLLVAARPWLWAAWGAGALGWWGLAAWRIVRFRRVLHDARPADDDLYDQVQALADRLGLKSCPDVGFVPGRVPPLVWSIGGAPRVILPETLWKELEPEARESLLIHELAHLRRRDHWTRWLELLTGGLYWWLPVVWWTRRALRAAEEQCCDAWVVATRPDSARTYARALLATLDFLSEPRSATPLGASGIGHVSCLKRRMTMIVRAQTPKTLSWPGRLAVLTLGATLLPLAPTWAQRDQPPKDAAPAPEAPAREEDAGDKGPGPSARERMQHYRRMMEHLPIPDERMKKQLDEAISQMEKAFDLGKVSEDEIRRGLERMHHDVAESLERARVAARERREADDAAPKPKDAPREESPERRAQLEKARAEIRELHEKLRQAEERLAELEGRPRNRYRVVEEFVRSRRAEPRADQPRRAEAPDRRPAERPIVPHGADRRPDAPPAPEEGNRGVPEQRVRQLEERLERLLKEMQDLKSELRGGDRDKPRR